MVRGARLGQDILDWGGIYRAEAGCGPTTLSLGRLAELRRAPAMGWLSLAQGREARQDESMAMESKRVEVLEMG